MRLLGVVPNRTVFPRVLSHSDPVMMKDLSLERFSSVPCPARSVAAGKRCRLHWGALRSESRIDTKLSAAEAIEAKRFRRTQSLAKRGKALDY